MKLRQVQRFGKGNRPTVEELPNISIHHVVHRVGFVMRSALGEENHGEVPRNTPNRAAAAIMMRAAAEPKAPLPTPKPTDKTPATNIRSQRKTSPASVSAIASPRLTQCPCECPSRRAWPTNGCPPSSSTGGSPRT